MLKGEPHTVVGVLPQGAITPLNADIFTPLKPSREGEGLGTNFDAILRLRDGATWQEADAQINRAWAIRAQRLEKDVPGAKVTYYSVTPLGMPLLSNFCLVLAVVLIVQVISPNSSRVWSVRVIVAVTTPASL